MVLIGLYIIISRIILITAKSRSLQKLSFSDNLFSAYLIPIHYVK